MPFALSVPDAVAYSRIGRSTIYTALRNGELRARKVRGRTLILRTDLEAWITDSPAYAEQGAA